MAPLTNNYNTVEDTSLTDTSVGVPLSSGQMQSTFLKSVLNNKLVVTLVVVVVGMAYYSTTPVTSPYEFGDYGAIVDGSKGGGITGTSIIESSGCSLFPAALAALAVNLPVGCAAIAATPNSAIDTLSYTNEK
eukprot:CAMPEP_0170781424 /NCGR_PEP_ID=MMETSP0733-20121128/14193_1 /TAXON_ID=186038 /ORGANISM="Fragilariopsis kerguelensis, Strain L26-C5" /LENGTH=132 /DNA_ID=CAMNT_0011125465 /DNA_START=34 /DNA_END=433 /DNA_ORIENTATION=+